MAARAPDCASGADPLAGVVSSPKARLKKADPVVKMYVAELEKENARLQAQIVKYEAKQLSLDNKVKAVERELKENKPQFVVNLDTGRPNWNAMTKEQLEEYLHQAAERAGYNLVKKA